MTIPALVPDQTRRCEICLAGANEAHHILHRSQGGADHAHNLIDLCRRCHDRCHPEKSGGVGWKVAHTHDFLEVLDGDSVIVRRPLHPLSELEQGQLVAELQQSPQRLRALSLRFERLEEDALLGVSQALVDLQQATWDVQARLLRTAKLRMPYGSRTEKFKAIVKELDLSPSQAYKLVAAVTVVDREPLFQQLEKYPSPDAVLLMEAHGDVEAALDLYTDRKAASGGRYTSREFAVELHAGVTDSSTAPPERHQCPDCGGWHTVNRVQGG